MGGVRREETPGKTVNECGGVGRGRGIVGEVEGDDRENKEGLENRDNGGFSQRFKNRNTLFI